jgi:hypothetical protein
LGRVTIFIEISEDVPAKTKQASFFAVTSSIFLC